ncbi:YihY/virulence factor BrkB family protein [uncultured Anaerococcus sp.]|uniref:YihY/virulence factor BrkB family protein n=1 Tax=uncultured Anaerococcus sp. TaxID=293428 RepID=UPI0025D9F9C5|nr:YihY/virulence factor BrkB family protein [uncultured Anaerococcus sp.]
MKLSKSKFQDFLKNLTNRLKNQDIMTYSAALSFYFLQASIPLMMVLVSVVSTFLKGNETIIYEFLDLVPKSTADIIIKALDIMFASSQSAAVTTFTVLFALWSATSGVNKLIMAINHAYGLGHQSKAIKQRLMSIIYTIVFIAFIMFMLVFQIYGPTILNILDSKILDITGKFLGKNLEFVIDFLSSPIFTILTTAIPLLIMSAALGIFYKYAPGNSENRIPFKQALVGGVFATLAIYVTSLVYSFFTNNFSNKSVIYGALAGILALFIWLLIVSSLLIIGAEVIASYREGYRGEYFDKNIEIETNGVSPVNKIVKVIKDKIDEE